jgi:hypothetical protein
MRMINGDRIEYNRETGKMQALGRPKIIFKTNGANTP